MFLFMSESAEVLRGSDVILFPAWSVAGTDEVAVLDVAASPCVYFSAL